MQTTDITLRLWTAARAMFARLRAAVGETAAIAARTAMSTEEAREIRAWLRPLEAMVRKIVLIEAAALARRPVTPARTRPQTPPPRPPAVTLVALPPPVRIVAPALAHKSKPRPPSLRLWRHTPISSGPRVRDLGAPLLARDAWRDRARLAQARHLAEVRRRRRPLHERLARRIEAIERLIAAPLAAARRLARKLRALPSLAFSLACKSQPRTRLYAQPEYADVGACAYDAVMADTS